MCLFVASSTDVLNYMFIQVTGRCICHEDDALKLLSFMDHMYFHVAKEAKLNVWLLHP